MKPARFLSSPTFLLLVLIWLIIIGLAVNLSSCRKKTEPIDPVANVDTLAPKITNMAIPGIPAENIKIDQVKRLLIVTLPKSFTNTGLSGKVWFQISPDAKLSRVGDVGIYFCGGVFYSNQFKPTLPGDMPTDNREISVTDGTTTKMYRLQLKPEGDIYFDTPNKTYKTKSDGTGETFKDVRVVNYMDSSASAKLLYKNIFTGQEFIFEVNKCELKGSMIPSSSFRKLPLGYYEITIVKSNGRQSARGLRMFMTAGKANFEGFSHALNEGFVATVTGNSLYEGSVKGIEIQSVRGAAKYTLDIIRYDATGSSIGVQLPSNIASGHYLSQLIFSDGTRSEKKSAYILKTTIQPQLGSSIQGAATNGANELMMKRGTTYYIFPSPNEEIGRGTDCAIVLQSLQDPTILYTIPVAIPSSFRYIASPWMLEQYPSFLITDAVKPGKYQMRLQYSDVSGIDQIGDWIDKDVSIQ